LPLTINKKQSATAKKSNPNLNNATTGATPVAEPDGPQEAPTPATPATPGVATSFNNGASKSQPNPPPQVVPNGQLSAGPGAGASQPPVNVSPHPEPNQGNFMDATAGLV